MGLTLDMSPRALEEVIYFAAYVVIDPKETPLEPKSLLTEREYREKLQEYGPVSYTHLDVYKRQVLCKLCQSLL